MKIRMRGKAEVLGATVGAMFSCAVLVTAFVLPASAQDRDALVARGQYLVNGPAACANCHTQRGPDLFSIASKYLAGGERFDTPRFDAYSKNITTDFDTGIGTWTEVQIIRAFREGISKEGATLGPPMPIEIYHNMSDDDAKAIAAYLRTVKPIHNEVPESKYKIPIKPEQPAKGLPAPPKTDKVAYGSYLVNAVAHCFECHTANVGPVRDYEHQLAAGGFPFTVAGATIQSRNITPDKDTGIGSWTDDEIKRAITEGIDKDGKLLIPIMPYPYLKSMTADDLDAVVAYLHTIPPVKKKIEPNPPLKSLQK